MWLGQKTTMSFLPTLPIRYCYHLPKTALLDIWQVYVSPVSCHLPKNLCDLYINKAQC